MRRPLCKDHAYTCMMFSAVPLICLGFATTYRPFTVENLRSQTSVAGHGSEIAFPRGELGLALESEDDDTIEKRRL